jgi:hypothetical protein
MPYLNLTVSQLTDWTIKFVKDETTNIDERMYRETVNKGDRFRSSLGNIMEK